jgi:hypothetical protein
MMIRRCLAALFLAGAILLGVGTGPAFAEGPKVPSGCSFDRGVLTCVTATTTPLSVGPVYAGNLPVSTDFEGFTGAQICEFLGVPDAIVLDSNGVVLHGTVTTTTTTERHGLHGRVFDTSVATSTTLTNILPIDRFSRVTCVVS